MTDDSAASAYFGLLVPFDDASPSFVHGFEAGMVWARMEAGDAAIRGHDDMPVHSANVGLFLRMGAARGYEVDVRPTAYEEWSTVAFTKRARPRLSVVDGGAS